MLFLNLFRLCRNVSTPWAVAVPTAASVVEAAAVATVHLALTIIVLAIIVGLLRLKTYPATVVVVLFISSEADKLHN
jgi:cytochrome b561